MLSECIYTSGGGGDALYTDLKYGSSSSLEDTNIDKNKAKYIFLGIASGTAYVDIFKVENGVVTFVTGSLYNGSPLFRVDVSGSTIKTGQLVSSNTMSYYACVVYAQ